MKISKCRFSKRMMQGRRDRLTDEMRRIKVPVALRTIDKDGYVHVLSSGHNDLLTLCGISFDYDHDCKMTRSKVNCLGCLIEILHVLEGVKYV